MFRKFIENLCSDIKNSIFIWLFLIYSSLTRLALFTYAYFEKQVNIEGALDVFLSGIVSDFVSASYGFLFVSIFRIISYKFESNATYRNLSLYIAFGTLNAIFLFNLISEIFFWDEFSTRFNFIAVDYLIYTNEIIGTIKEDVPYIKISLAFALLLSCIIYLSRNMLNNHATTRKIFPYHLVIFALITSSIAYNIYDQEKIFFRKNSYEKDLAKNGIYEFIYAFFNNELDYNQFYPQLNPQEAEKIVRNKILQTGDRFISEQGISRTVNGKNILKRNVQPNFVVILVESLSAEYLGVFGNKDNLTPFIDKISKESILFTRAYASGTRTVRGLEAVSKSIPPTPGSSILRRPHNENIFSISTVLAPRGYKLDFVYGGFSYFDNMKYFYENNGFEVTDRNDFESHEISFANAWGVSDGDAFNRLIKILDKRHAEKNPFFSLFVTTSNHRPYTFPDNTVNMPQGRRSSVVRYTDYAIEKFFEVAQTKAWFDDTIFVIVADHCASSAGKTKLPPEKYHIPFIIYAPEILDPKRIDYLVSQIDVVPTIFGLAGFEYESKFYGVDALKSEPGRAYIATYQLLGYMNDEYLAILSPRKEPIINGKKPMNDREKDFINEAISFYQDSYNFFKQEQESKK